MLLQDDFESAKVVVIASRSTSNAEHQYPQLDLEATGIDFALCRFWNYLVGAPEVIVITDHKRLCPILKEQGPYNQTELNFDTNTSITL